MFARQFNLFFKTWKTKYFNYFGFLKLSCSKKKLGNLEVEIPTSFIFAALKNYWVNCSGDLEKLKYVTSAMNYLYEDFDPNPYIAKKKPFMLENYFIAK